MKACPNCRVIHPDEYMGTCQECGAPMGGVSANGDASLNFAFAQQVQRSRQENATEQQLRRGDYSRVSLEDRLMEIAHAGAYLLEKAAGRDVSNWEEDDAA